MSLKLLAKQTFIYGFSTMALRMLTMLLAFYFTHYIDKKEIGINADLLSITAFLNIVYMLGMETSYFRYSKDYGEERIFSLSQTIVFINSLVLSILLCLLATPLINLSGYSGKEIYVYLLAAILFFENTSNLLFASLRYKEQAWTFMRLKAYNVLLNVGLTVVFISFIYSGKWVLPFTISSDPNVLILLAMLIPWVLTFLYFSPRIIKNLSLTDKSLTKDLLRYSYPLVVVGFAGMVNELADRQLLKHLLPYSFDKNLEQLALYSVNYRLSMAMTLAIQAFRMGAEPFFFKEASNKNSPQTYATVMDFFIIVCSVIMTLTNLFSEPIALMLYESSYKEALGIVPVLLLAGLFLGIYYNTTIWYKLTNNTSKGAIITLIGAAISLLANFILIPKIGYIGAAIAHLACYFCMTTISVLWGQKHYPIPYHYFYNLLWIVLSLVYGYLIAHFVSDNIYLTVVSALVYLGVVCYFGYRRFLFIKNWQG